MIGAPLSSSFSPLLTPALRPATGVGVAPPASASGWLEGLGLNGGPALRADVAGDQRGLSVPQHAERVLAALVG